MNPAAHPCPAYIVTIDGPAGAGKTTVSRRLADRLGYRYIDTGALYRAVALACLEAGVDPADDQALADLCHAIQIDFRETQNGLRLMLKGSDATERIRTPQISMLASAISARPVVREALLAIQRALGSRKRGVVEGRDVGTVVFPDADVKFFLDADPGIRARRLHRELAEGSDAPPTLQEVEKDMQQRDRNDSTRSIAPLRPAPDAVHIDSTGLSIGQVVDTMIAHITRNACGP